MSKAKHIEIRHFYTMVNQRLNEHDLQQLCAKAKNSELLEIKIKAIQKTLETYKNYSNKTDIEKKDLVQTNKELQQNIKELKINEEVYKEALEILSAHYKLPQNAIKQTLRYAQNKLEENEFERS